MKAERKLYRVYFNRRREWPQIWSVDEGDQSSEINVKEVDIIVPVYTKSLGSEAALAATNPDTTPFAWMECTGVLILSNGVATIKHE